VGKKDEAELTARYADMLSAIGTEPRLRIIRLLLSVHAEGMVVAGIENELDIPYAGDPAKRASQFQPRCGRGIAVRVAVILAQRRCRHPRW
jgi:hypothetical protein